MLVENTPLSSHGKIQKIICEDKLNQAVLPEDPESCIGQIGQRP